MIFPNLAFFFFYSVVMHRQYASIKSIMDKISAAGIDPKDYISFFSLRGYREHDFNVKGIQKGNFLSSSIEYSKQKILY